LTYDSTTVSTLQ